MTDLHAVASFRSLPLRLHSYYATALARRDSDCACPMQVVGSVQWNAAHVRHVASGGGAAAGMGTAGRGMGTAGRGGCTAQLRQPGSECAAAFSTAYGGMGVLCGQRRQVVTSVACIYRCGSTSHAAGSTSAMAAQLGDGDMGGQALEEVQRTGTDSCGTSMQAAYVQSAFAVTPAHQMGFSWMMAAHPQGRTCMLFTEDHKLLAYELLLG